MAKKKLAVVEKLEIIRLDIGCGKNKKQGFIGVDQYPIEGVDIVMDLRGKWPWKDGSVEEAYCSHFIEHLDQIERCRFMNELYRVLRVGGKCTLIAPHWASNRAYGDPTHKWPAISEMFFYYLSKDFREQQTPHTDKKLWRYGYDCDFEATWGYSMNPALVNRNQEYQQNAIQFWKEAAQDTIATLTKK